MNEYQKIKKIPIVIISTFGHCGIDWLHSLIDSHKEILIIPSLSFFRKVHALKKNKGIEMNNSFKTKLIRKNIMSMLIKKNSSGLSQRHLILKSDQKKIFEKYLANFLTKDDEKNLEKKFFWGIHYAYSKIKKINLNKMKVIVTQEHVPWNCEKYETYFNSKYVFMMRDPRASIAGCIKAHKEKKLMSYYFDHHLSFIISAKKFSKKMLKKNKILILKNEEMHNNLNKEMKKLSIWLGIKFSRSLLKSTFSGKKWIGESVYLSKGDLKKPYPKNYYLAKNVENRWRGILNKKQIIMIETLTEDIMRNNKYKFDNNLNFLLRFAAYVRFFFSFHDFNKFFPLFKNITRRIFVVFFSKYSRKIFDIA